MYLGLSFLHSMCNLMLLVESHTFCWELWIYGCQHGPFASGWLLVDDEELSPRPSYSPGTSDSPMVCQKFPQTMGTLVIDSRVRTGME